MTVLPPFCCRRVQRVHKVQRVQRGWYRRFTAMSIYAACGGNAAGGSENQTTAPAARWKYTPLGAAHHFPRRGKFSRRSASRLINISMHRGAKISPSGEDVADRRQKGCISIARQGGWLVFLRAKPGCMIFSPLLPPFPLNRGKGGAVRHQRGPAAAGSIYTHRRQAIPQPPPRIREYIQAPLPGFAP